MAGIPSASQSAAAIVDVMHSVVQGDLPRGAQVGIVVSPPPSLVVKMNNIEITAKDVYCSRYLLSGYTRHMVGQTSDRGGGSGDAAYESHNHPIDNDETWTDTLKPGTLVLLIPIYGQNEQLYWLADSGVKL
ncbi:hypothetical protein G153_09623 [Megasphaera sp. BL7]|uniref:DUF2577 family protein n=1 Tax=unclassified Megasphaera TaxID=2626256 RepID=UPI000357CA6B|nr:MULTISPECIES: DUF2577 family protein [unclassified Megasphaera]EPP15561.1 hypothetical protein G153_09623 [Megasphaera sp. BL7]EPP18920.1 hypothetical protein NM10_01009 [Megasphaera sp. NM10]